jgi:uncharacterized lipoprotein NlpE involved in copper resistance
MKNKIIIITCISCLFFNCKKEVKIENEKQDTLKTTVNAIAKDNHNSQNALDWYGVYKGTTPCADCEGILTEITLNKDLTFIIKTKYLGKENQTFFEKKGTFVWDSKGLIISLNELKGSPNQYKVSENKLTQLDMEGKEISGTLADKYVLKK